MEEDEESNAMTRTIMAIMMIMTVLIAIEAMMAMTVLMAMMEMMATTTSRLAASATSSPASILPAGRYLRNAGDIYDAVANIFNIGSVLVMTMLVALSTIMIDEPVQNELGKLTTVQHKKTLPPASSAPVKGTLKIEVGKTLKTLKIEVVKTLKP